MRTLTFGEGVDNLPVQIDVDDPTPGSILIIGDACGKTRLLNSVATHAVEIPLCSIYAITDRPREAVGVPRGYVRSFANSGRLLSALVDRLVPDQFPPVILLVDGIDNILEENQRKDFLRLFNDGPRFHIWPFVTMNSKKVSPSVIEWIDKTHLTTVFGRITNKGLIAKLNSRFTAIELLEDNWFWTKGVGMFAV